MKKSLLGFSALCLLLPLLANASPGQTPQPVNAGEDKTPPSYDMKAQALFDLQDLHKKMVALANAIPAEKYTWRPEAGTRSISELFLHVTAANHNIVGLMTGIAPEPAFRADDFQTSTTDKAKIISQLDQSFAYAEASVKAMANSDFARPEKKLGPDANSGDVVYILVTHTHEHFGQSIAYARMNGITPPWTVEAQKKAAAAKDSKPAKEN